MRKEVKSEHFDQIQPSIPPTFNKKNSKKFVAVYETPQFPELPNEFDRQYWEGFLDMFEYNMKGNTEILIEKAHFDEGKNSYVFKIFDIKRQLNMVGKIDKRVYYRRSNRDYETCEDRMIS